MFNEIVKASTALEVSDFIENIPQDAKIFLDVDDTLITPVSKTFRASPFNQIIDDIKKNKDAFHNYIDIVSNWRQRRKVMLVDNSWPSIIDKLKLERSVFALTKMDTGEFGGIDSLSEWRYKELMSFGITFSNSADYPQYKLNKKNGPEFYKGIFLTGRYSKGELLQFYHQELQMNFMVMVDDRMDYLLNIRDYCIKNSVGFLGILFEGLGLIMEEIDPKIAEFQKEYLIKYARWLEDEEALVLINNLKLK